MGYIAYHANNNNSSTSNSNNNNSTLLLLNNSGGNKKNPKLMWYRMYRPSKQYVDNKKELRFTHSKYKLRDDTLIIQVVKEAPKPNFLLKGYKLKNKIWKLPKATEFFLNNTSEVRLDDDVFKQNLRNDWKSTKLSWIDTPQLLEDFQFLFDYQGRIWHMDFDRINGFIAMHNKKKNDNNNNNNTSSSSLSSSSSIISDNDNNVTTISISISSKLNHIEEYIINELLKFNKSKIQKKI